jgi:hypothetical protein
LRGFRADPICDRLPPVATTGLHEGSIFCNQLRQQSACRKALLITSLIERGSSGFAIAFRCPLWSALEP